MKRELKLCSFLHVKSCSASSFVMCAEFNVLVLCEHADFLRGLLCDHIDCMGRSYFDASISCGNEVSERLLLCNHIGHNYT